MISIFTSPTSPPTSPPTPSPPTPTPTHLPSSLLLHLLQCLFWCFVALKRELRREWGRLGLLIGYRAGEGRKKGRRGGGVWSFGLGQPKESWKLAVGARRRGFGVGLGLWWLCGVVLCSASGAWGAPITTNGNASFRFVSQSYTQPTAGTSGSIGEEDRVTGVVGLDWGGVFLAGYGTRFFDVSCAAGVTNRAGTQTEKAVRFAVQESGTSGCGVWVDALVTSADASAPNNPATDIEEQTVVQVAGVGQLVFVLVNGAPIRPLQLKSGGPLIDTWVSGQQRSALLRFDVSPSSTGGGEALSGVQFAGWSGDPMKYYGVGVAAGWMEAGGAGVFVAFEARQNAASGTARMYFHDLDSSAATQWTKTTTDIDNRGVIAGYNASLEMEEPLWVAEVEFAATSSSDPGAIEAIAFDGASWVYVMFYAGIGNPKLVSGDGNSANDVSLPANSAGAARRTVLARFDAVTGVPDASSSNWWWDVREEDDISGADPGNFDTKVALAAGQLVSGQRGVAFARVMYGQMKVGRGDGEVTIAVDSFDSVLEQAIAVVLITDTAYEHTNEAKRTPLWTATVDSDRWDEELGGIQWDSPGESLWLWGETDRPCTASKGPQPFLVGPMGEEEDTGWGCTGENSGNTKLRSFVLSIDLESAKPRTMWGWSWWWTAVSTYPKTIYDLAFVKEPASTSEAAAVSKGWPSTSNLPPQVSQHESAPGRRALVVVGEVEMDDEDTLFGGRDLGSDEFVDILYHTEPRSSYPHSYGLVLRAVPGVHPAVSLADDLPTLYAATMDPADLDPLVVGIPRGVLSAGAWITVAVDGNESPRIYINRTQVVSGQVVVKWDTLGELATQLLQPGSHSITLYGADVWGAAAEVSVPVTTSSGNPAVRIIAPTTSSAFTTPNTSLYFTIDCASSGTSSSTSSLTAGQALVSSIEYRLLPSTAVTPEEIDAVAWKLTGPASFSGGECAARVISQYDYTTGLPLEEPTACNASVLGNAPTSSSVKIKPSVGNYATWTFQARCSSAYGLDSIEDAELAVVYDAVAPTSLFLSTPPEFHRAVRSEFELGCEQIDSLGVDRSGALVCSHQWRVPETTNVWRRVGDGTSSSSTSSEDNRAVRFSFAEAACVTTFVSVVTDDPILGGAMGGVQDVVESGLWRLDDLSQVGGVMVNSTNVGFLLETSGGKEVSNFAAKYWMRASPDATLSYAGPSGGGIETFFIPSSSSNKSRSDVVWLSALQEETFSPGSKPPIVAAKAQGIHAFSVSATADGTLDPTSAGAQIIVSSLAPSVAITSLPRSTWAYDESLVDGGEMAIVTLSCDAEALDALRSSSLVAASSMPISPVSPLPCWFRYRLNQGAWQSSTSPDLFLNPLEFRSGVNTIEVAALSPLGPMSNVVAAAWTHTPRFFQAVERPPTPVLLASPPTLVAIDKRIVFLLSTDPDSAFLQSSNSSDLSTALEEARTEEEMVLVVQGLGGVGRNFAPTPYVQHAEVDDDEQRWSIEWQIVPSSTQFSSLRAHEWKASTAGLVVLPAGELENGWYTLYARSVRGDVGLTSQRALGSSGLLRRSFRVQSIPRWKSIGVPTTPLPSQPPPTTPTQPSLPCVTTVATSGTDSGSFELSMDFVPCTSGGSPITTATPLYLPDCVVRYQVTAQPPASELRDITFGRVGVVFSASPGSSFRPIIYGPRVLWNGTELFDAADEAVTTAWGSGTTEWEDDFTVVSTPSGASNPPIKSYKDDSTSISGRLIPEDRFDASYLPPASSSGDPLILQLDEAPWVNTYTSNQLVLRIEVEQIRMKVDGEGAGVVLRMLDANTYIAIVFVYGAGKTHHMVLRREGVSTSLAEFTCEGTWAANTQYVEDIVVEQVGSSIVVECGGEEVLDVILEDLIEVDSSAGCGRTGSVVVSQTGTLPSRGSVHSLELDTKDAAAHSLTVWAACAGVESTSRHATSLRVVTKEDSLLVLGAQTGALTEGTFTLQLRATDSLGTKQVFPSNYTWTIDTTPPVSTGALVSAFVAPNTPAASSSSSFAPDPWVPSSTRTPSQIGAPELSSTLSLMRGGSSSSAWLLAVRDVLGADGNVSVAFTTDRAMSGSDATNVPDTAWVSVDVFASEAVPIVGSRPEIGGAAHWICIGEYEDATATRASAALSDPGSLRVHVAGGEVFDGASPSSLAFDLPIAAVGPTSCNSLPSDAGVWSDSSAAILTAAPSIPDGTLWIRFAAVDWAGNVGTGEVLGVIFDATPPSITLTAPRPHLVWSPSAGVEVTLTSTESAVEVDVWIEVWDGNFTTLLLSNPRAEAEEEEWESDPSVVVRSSSNPSVLGPADTLIPPTIDDSSFFLNLSTPAATFGGSTFLLSLQFPSMPQQKFPGGAVVRVRTQPRDLAGNVGLVATRSIFLDTVPPQLDCSAPLHTILSPYGVDEYGVNIPMQQSPNLTIHCIASEVLGEVQIADFAKSEWHTVWRRDADWGEASPATSDPFQGTASLPRATLSHAAYFVPNSNSQQISGNSPAGGKEFGYAVETNAGVAESEEGPVDDTEPPFARVRPAEGLILRMWNVPETKNLDTSVEESDGAFGVWIRAFDLAGRQQEVRRGFASSSFQTSATDTLVAVAIDSTPPSFVGTEWEGMPSCPTPASYPSSDALTTNQFPYTGTRYHSCRNALPVLTAPSLSLAADVSERFVSIEILLAWYEESPDASGSDPYDPIDESTGSTGTLDSSSADASTWATESASSVQGVLATSSSLPRIAENLTSLCTTTANNGRVTVECNNLPYSRGVYALAASLSDPAGNVMPQPRAIAFAVDAKPPRGFMRFTVGSDEVEVLGPVEARRTEEVGGAVDSTLPTEWPSGLNVELATRAESAEAIGIDVNCAGLTGWVDGEAVANAPDPRSPSPTTQIQDDDGPRECLVDFQLLYQRHAGTRTPPPLRAAQLVQQDVGVIPLGMIGPWNESYRFVTDSWRTQPGAHTSDPNIVEELADDAGDGPDGLYAIRVRAADVSTFPGQWTRWVAWAVDNVPPAVTLEQVPGDAELALFTRGPSTGLPRFVLTCKEASAGGAECNIFLAHDSISISSDACDPISARRLYQSSRHRFQRRRMAGDSGTPEPLPEVTGLDGEVLDWRSEDEIATSEVVFKSLSGSELVAMGLEDSGAQVLLVTLQPGLTGTDTSAGVVWVAVRDASGNVAPLASDVRFRVDSTSPPSLILKSSPLAVVGLRDTYRVDWVGLLAREAGSPSGTWDPDVGAGDPGVEYGLTVDLRSKVRDFTFDFDTSQLNPFSPSPTDTLLPGQIPITDELAEACAMLQSEVRSYDQSSLDIDGEGIEGTWFLASVTIDTGASSYPLFVEADAIDNTTAVAGRACVLPPMTLRGLIEAEYTVQLLPVDAAGNRGPSTDVVWQISDELPTVEIVKRPPSVTSLSDVTIKGRVLLSGVAPTSGNLVVVVTAAAGAVTLKFPVDPVTGIAVAKFEDLSEDEYIVELYGEVGTAVTTQDERKRLRFRIATCSATQYQELDEDGELSCHDCHEGADCTDPYVEWETMAARPGWWTTGSRRDVYIRCQLPAACPGGLGLNGTKSICAEAYDGVLCAQCAVGFFRQFGQCTACPNSGGAAWGVVVGGGIVMVLAMAMFVKFKAMVPVVVAKILLTYGQILAAANSAYDIPWPTSIRALLEVSRLAMLDLFALTQVSCAQPVLFYVQFDVMSLGFLFIVVVLIISGFYTSCDARKNCSRFGKWIGCVERRSKGIVTDLTAKEQRQHLAAKSPTPLPPPSSPSSAPSSRRGFFSFGSGRSAASRITGDDDGAGKSGEGSSQLVSNPMLAMKGRDASGASLPQSPSASTRSIDITSLVKKDPKDRVYSRGKTQIQGAVLDMYAGKWEEIHHASSKGGPGALVGVSKTLTRSQSGMLPRTLSRSASSASMMTQDDTDRENFGELMVDVGDACGCNGEEGANTTIGQYSCQKKAQVVFSVFCCCGRRCRPSTRKGAVVKLSKEERDRKRWVRRGGSGNEAVDILRTSCADVNRSLQIRFEPCRSTAVFCSLLCTGRIPRFVEEEDKKRARVKFQEALRNLRGTDRAVIAQEEMDYAGAFGIRRGLGEEMSLASEVDAYCCVRWRKAARWVREDSEQRIIALHRERVLSQAQRHADRRARADAYYRLPLRTMLRLDSRVLRAGKTVRWLLLWLVLAYAPISLISMRMIRCINVEDKYYLEADTRIMCSGPAYAFHSTCAVTLLIAYTALFPIALIAYLRYHIAGISLVLDTLMHKKKRRRTVPKWEEKLLRLPPPKALPSLPPPPKVLKPKKSQAQLIPSSPTSLATRKKPKVNPYRDIMSADVATEIMFRAFDIAYGAVQRGRAAKLPPRVQRYAAFREREAANALIRVGMVFQDYKTEVFWYESQELVRKLLLTALVMLIPKGSPLQVSTALLIAVLAVVVLFTFRPYRDVDAQTLQQWALVTLFLVFFLGALFKMDGLAPEEDTTATSATSTSTSSSTSPITTSTNTTTTNSTADAFSGDDCPTQSSVDTGLATETEQNIAAASTVVLVVMVVIVFAFGLYLFIRGCVHRCKSAAAENNRALLAKSQPASSGPQAASEVAKRIDEDDEEDGKEGSDRAMDFSDLASPTGSEDGSEGSGDASTEKEKKKKDADLEPDEISIIARIRASKYRSTQNPLLAIRRE